MEQHIGECARENVQGVPCKGRIKTDSGNDAVGFLGGFENGKEKDHPQEGVETAGDGG